MTLVAPVARPRAATRRGRPPATPLDPVTAYATEVAEGRIVAGKLVRLAAERHLRDLVEGPTRGLRFNVAEAQRSIDFFPLAITHWKGDWAGKAVVLEPWQEFIVGAAFGWQRWSETRDRWLRRFSLIYVEVAKKNGKAIALDTPIPTPAGWTTMGELREGDEILDEAGRSARVVFATEVMRGHPCYRVTFSDGDSIVADAEHLWQTEALRHHVYEPGVRTTAEIAADLARADGARIHRIPLAAPLTLPAADLPVDPYVLGAWLGDGDSRQAVLTVGEQDHELVDLVAAAGSIAVHARPRSRYRLGGTDRPRSRSDVATALRQLGVMGNKHIPPAYLRGSIDQRLALLQGLMDTDGSVSPRGQCEFSTTRAALRDGFLELARTLGYKAVATEGVARLYGREIGPKWRITFHGRRDAPPFRLARKLLRVAAPPARAQRSRNRHIVAVESVPSVPVRCIQVDSPSSLYLAGAAMVPTHNTLMGAGFGLRLAFFDGEAGAEVYSCATKRDQAKFVWNDARRAVRKSPALARRIQVSDSTVTLYDTTTGSKFEPLGRDSDSDQGINVHGAVLDELHVHRDRLLYDNIETATASRAQPMRVVITTAGVRRESIWWDVRSDVVRVLDGRAEDDSILGFIATLDDDDDDPFDEAVWPKANPNLGVSVGLEFLRGQAEKARRNPGMRASYLRFHMNMPTDKSTGAIDIDEWDECAALEPVIVPGEVGFGGLDLAQLTDLTALVEVFAREDGFVDVKAHFWCPAEAIDERSRLDGVPYREWAEAGWITVTGGDTTDFAFIRERLLTLDEQILEFGYDPWQAMQLALELQQAGAVMVPIRQTHAGLAPGWHELERLIVEHKLRVGANPVLRWMAGNVEVELDAQGNRKPSKVHSRERIDGMVALDMAIGRAMAHGAAPAWRMV